MIVSCVFPPEPVVSSRTSFDVARELAARGHDVAVIAPFPNRPAGKLYPGYRRSLFRSEARPERFRITRCFSTISRRSSMVSRFAENISFAITSSIALLIRAKPDVVYVNSWPIFGTAMIIVAARLRRIPIVLSVQDLYPESLMSQSRKASRILNRLLLAIDRRTVRAVDAVVVISPKFSEHYRHTRRVGDGAVHVVPNWVSAEHTEEIDGRAAACRSRNGIPPNAFLLTYGGNIGVAAAVEKAIKAFRELADRPDIHLLIAGEGAMLEDCRGLAGTVSPDRVHFEAPWVDTMGPLHAADAVVLPTRASQSLVSVPSKLMTYLLSARPIIAMALEESDTAEVIRRSGAGVVIPPDDTRRLAEAIRAMANLDRDARSRMGKSGRNWALANVTTEACLPRLIGLIERIGSRPEVTVTSEVPLKRTP